MIKNKHTMIHGRVVSLKLYAEKQVVKNRVEVKIRTESLSFVLPC